MIIDAHVHLWKKQQGAIADGPVEGLSGGRSDFAGQLRQMMPPYLVDGANPVEPLLANMDYAQVNGAVITQEYMDGNQDDYLLEVRSRYPDRIRICSLYEEKEGYRLEGFDGIKLCAARMKAPLETALPVFEAAQAAGKFVALELVEGDAQVAAMEQILKVCPDVKVALGHFGMAGRPGWERQIELACHPNVYVECGGITWLYHKEFYPYPSAVAAILRAKEICGMDKLMWGSDYPRTMTAITYRMSKDFIPESGAFSPEELSMFLGETARKFYGFPQLEELPYIPNMVED